MSISDKVIVTMALAVIYMLNGYSLKLGRQNRRDIEALRIEFRLHEERGY